MKPYFDSNPPDDEPDLLLDDVSFHHDSFDIQHSDLEIAEPENNKKRG